MSRERLPTDLAHILCWELPWGSVFGGRQFGCLGVADDLVCLRIKLNCSSHFHRQVGKGEGQVDFMMIIDVTTWLFSGPDTIQPLTLVAG